MASEAIRLTPTRVSLTCLYLLAYPLLLIGLSGDWSWLEGWLFSLWFVLLSGATMLYLYRKDPALLAERYRRPGTGNEASWDRYVVYSLGALFLGWFAVMPLDARRFGWTPVMPLWVTVLGAALLMVGSFFMFRAFADNTFLSPLVRIQSERKHRVVSTGVYGLVRHPLYLGATCMALGAPLFLGSLWGLACGALIVAVLMIRIVGEERLLVSQLAGYASYREKVRYRLLPFVW